MEVIKNNKLKSIVYIAFILIWFGFQYYKGVYVTTDIYDGLVDFTWNDRTYIILLNTLTLFFFLTLISVKGFKTILIIYSIISSCILLGDLPYGRYYNSPLSITLIDQIALLGSLGGSIEALITKKDLWIIADVPILLILSIYLRKFSFKIRYGYRLVAGFVMVLVFGNMSKTKYNEYYNERYQYNRKEIGMDLGVYTFHALDFKNYFTAKFETYIPVTQEEKTLIENSNQAVEEDYINEYTGILEGKNVVVIQLEAFQNFFINQEFNGVEVTPNLNKLIKENSIYASNFYYETAGGNTVDAELLTNTSLLPTYAGSAYYLYPNNTYIAMPKIFRDLGYTANSFHAYEPTFWNREIMHNTLGFEEFYSKGDFEISEEDVLGWSLNDEKFLKDSLDKSLLAAGFNSEESLSSSSSVELDYKNFYSYMITLSSHYPYDAFYNGNYTWMLGRTEGEVPLFERYLNAAQYVDYAIGEFIEYTKEKGVYEDTVFVMFGDHGGLFNEERLDMLNTLGLEESEQQYAKLEMVPLIIHNVDINDSIIVDKVCGQKDTMATLANLMNFELPYTFGRDILDENYEGVAIKRYGNVYTNNYIFLHEQDKFYDYETLEEITDQELLDEYKKEVNNYHKYISADELILKYDYLRGYE